MTNSEFTEKIQVLDRAINQLALALNDECCFSKNFKTEESQDLIWEAYQLTKAMKIQLSTIAGIRQYLTKD